MLHYELANERQKDLRREAAQLHAANSSESRIDHSLFTPARRTLARVRATLNYLRETKPIRRRVVAWFS